MHQESYTFVANLPIASPIVWAILSGWLGLAVAALSPGPNMFAVVSASLGGGLNRGLQVNLGIAMGAFIWATLANLGLASLLAVHPFAVKIIALFGGGYLLFLAFKGMRSAFNTKAEPMISAQAERSLLKNIMHGLGVTFSNPKVALFWASISSIIASVTSDIWALGIFAIGASFTVFAIYGAYAFAFSTTAFRNIYHKFRRLADGLFGCVFAGLAMLVLSNLWA